MPAALATSALNAYSIQVRQTDAVGNVGSFSAALAFTVDLAPPTGGTIAHVPVANQVAGFTRAATANVTLTVGSTDNLAGAITYALTTVATPAPAAAAFGALTTQSVGVAATNGTVTTVFLWARDAAGNISPAPVASTPITFDNQPPTVLATSFPVPGVNATTAFGTLANVQINFSEPVQNPSHVDPHVHQPMRARGPRKRDLQRGHRADRLTRSHTDPRDRNEVRDRAPGGS